MSYLEDREQSSDEVAEPEPTPGNAPWIICPRGNADGKHSRGLGAFPMSEFNEQFAPDEQAEYFAGAYDRTCEPCKGSGKIRESQRYRHDQQLRHEQMMQRGVNEAGERLW